jgi:hypothetical protein
MANSIIGYLMLRIGVSQEIDSGETLFLYGFQMMENKLFV